jgi:hypothetical protein
MAWQRMDAAALPFIVNVFVVLRKVFPYPERFLHQVPEILGDLRFKVLLAEDFVHALTCGELDVGDGVPVTQYKADLACRHAVFAELDDDLLDLSCVRIGPLGRFLPVRSDRTTGSAAPSIHSCHSCTSVRYTMLSPEKSPFTD